MNSHPLCLVSNVILSCLVCLTNKCASVSISIKVDIPYKVKYGSVYYIRPTKVSQVFSFSYLLIHEFVIEHFYQIIVLK